LGALRVAAGWFRRWVQKMWRNSLTVVKCRLEMSI